MAIIGSGVQTITKPYWVHSAVSSHPDENEEEEDKEEKEQEDQEEEEEQQEKQDLDDDRKITDAAVDKVISQNEK